MNRQTIALWALAIALFGGTPPIFAKVKHDFKHLSHVSKIQRISISEIKNQGIKIKKPGVYHLTKDITVNLKDGKPAISIEANNVVLDLNHFTLRQKGVGQNNAGIIVRANHHSVTIQHGTVSKMHGFGIIVEENTHLINLEDLIVTSNGSNGAISLSNDQLHTGGIAFLGSLAAPIRDVALRRCVAVNNTTSDPLVALNGLVMVGVNQTTIQNCNFSQNKGVSEISVAGAEFFQTSNCVIENSQADANSNIPVNGANAGCFGFHFNVFSNSIDDSTEHFNIKVLNSTANQTTAHVIRAAGFRFRSARNIVIEGSESHQTINTLPDPLDVDPSITAAAGFLLSVCDDFTIRNCNAYEHATLTPSARVVGGFDIARSNFGVVTNCHAARCNNLGSGVLGGFVLEPGSGRPNFDRNVGVVFENSVSERNIGATQGGGFAFFRTDEGKIINCEAINNAPFGIQVGKPLPLDSTINSIFKDNIVMSNTSIGIFDDSPTSANAYLGNIARDNLVNFTLPLGSPIVVWPLSTGGALVAEDVDNIDIQ